MDEGSIKERMGDKRTRLRRKRRERKVSEEWNA